jgi:hypothetical protein
LGRTINDRLERQQQNKITLKTAIIQPWTSTYYLKHHQSSIIILLLGIIAVRLKVI